MALVTSRNYAIASDWGSVRGVPFFTAPSKTSYASRITKHGTAGNGAVASSGAFLRALGGLPFDPWTSSSYYPKAPNSHSFAVLGQMSVTGSALGAIGLHQTAKETMRAYEIEEKKGFKLKLLDVATSVAQVGLGLISQGSSTASIGMMVSPQNPVWPSIAAPLGLAGGIIGTILNGAIGVSHLFSIDFGLEKKYEEKGGVDYMRRRLGLDEDELENKALKGKTSSDLSQAGLKYLQPFAKRNLRLLQKHGFDPKVKNEEEFIRILLGSDEIEETGKNSLIDNLKEKKTEKMTRAIGGDSVKELTKLYNGDEPVEKADVDKIVLDGLKTTNRMRYLKIAICFVGFGSMLALSIFTAGMPLIAASILYSVVALCNMALAIDGLIQLQKAKGPPGEHEKAIPYLGILGATASIGVQIAIASVLSMGVAPIVVGIGIAVIFLGLYGYHIHTIDERRQSHGKLLLDEKKRDFSLEEMKYLCTHMPDEDLAYKVSPDHLIDEDRAEVLRFMRDEEAKGKNWRDLLLYSTKQRRKQVERQYVAELWDRYLSHSSS